MVDRLGKCGNGIEIPCVLCLKGTVLLIVVVALPCSVYIKALLIGCQGVLLNALCVCMYVVGNMTVTVTRRGGSHLLLGVSNCR